MHSQVWSKSYGGSNADIAVDIEKTDDGGFVLVGWSNSDNGDVSGNNGGQDGWVVKLDNEGDLEWENNFGGSDDDILTSVRQTSDGGIIVAGYSSSIDGDLAGNYGEQDSWVMKLDNEGNLEWTNNYGGSDKDLAVDIVQAVDNGYAVLCHSESFDGDVGGNNGGRDYWIIKLDNVGNLVWEENYGGSVWDTPSSIKLHTSGGYIISGWAGSNDGDVSANHGSNDSWLIKLDDDGSLEWEKNFGGSDSDVTYDFDQTSDGGYIMVGRSNSSDGEVGGNNGIHDTWILKLDSVGVFEWATTFGGSENDAAFSIVQTSDEGYILVGDTESNDGDISTNNGGRDSWVIKLNSEGILEWEQTYGGLSDDVARDIVRVTDDEFILANWSQSVDGDLIENNGSSDFWVTKIGLTTSLSQIQSIIPKVTIAPNPSKGQCTINIDDINTSMSVKVFGAVGQIIFKEFEVKESLSIDDLPKGSHFVQIESDEFSITRKLIVQ